MGAKFFGKIRQNVGDFFRGGEKAVSGNAVETRCIASLPMGSGRRRMAGRGVLDAMHRVSTDGIGVRISKGRDAGGW